MPVVQSINGVFTLYRDRSGGQRHKGPRRDLVSTEDGPPGNQVRPGVDTPALAVHRAYQQGLPGKPREPAVLAQDIMTSPVLTLSPDSPLTEAWTLMTSRDIRHIPIVSETGLLVGIISDRDILHLPKTLQQGLHSLPDALRDVMTTAVLTATRETPIQEISSVMLRENISALPILDTDHRPVGILTTTDILRALVSHARLELWT